MASTRAPRALRRAAESARRPAGARRGAERQQQWRQQRRGRGRDSDEAAPRRLAGYVPLALRLEFGRFLELRDRFQDLTTEAAAFQAELDDVTRLLAPGQAITLARQLNATTKGYNVLLDPLVSSLRPSTSQLGRPAGAQAGIPAPAPLLSAPTSPAFARSSLPAPPTPPNGARPRLSGNLGDRPAAAPASPGRMIRVASGEGDGACSAAPPGAAPPPLLFSNANGSAASPQLPSLSGQLQQRPASPGSLSPSSLSNSSSRGAGSNNGQRLPSLTTHTSDDRLPALLQGLAPLGGRTSPRATRRGSFSGGAEDAFATAAGSNGGSAAAPVAPRPPVSPSSDRSRLRRSSVTTPVRLPLAAPLDRERRASSSELFPDMLAGGMRKTTQRVPTPERSRRGTDEGCYMSLSSTGSSGGAELFPAPTEGRHAAKIRQYALVPGTPARWQALYRHLQDVHRQLAACQVAHGELVMRSNCEWADKYSWGPPDVHDQPCQHAWTEGELYQQLRLEIECKLRYGSMAIQLFAGQDGLWLPSGELQDLWTADPWLLVALCQPDKLPASPVVEGRSWGSRVLSQLVAAVTAVAGEAAVPRLTVILNINDQQQQQLLADAWEQPIYSQLRGNLLVVVHQRSSAYVYADDDRRFCEDSATPAESAGTGYSLTQLGLAGAAQVLTEEAELRPIEESVLDILAQRKVEWLMSHRARDLILLQPQGILDMATLTYSLHLAQTQRVNMTVQVSKAIGLSNCQTYDTVCLVRKPRQIGPPPPPPPPKDPFRPPTPARTSPELEAICELRHCDVASAKMQGVLKTTAHEYCNQIAVGLSRYLVHVPALAAAVQCPVTFRPKLALLGHAALRVSLDMADITCSHRLRCAALSARDHAGVVRTPQDVGLLVPYLMAHDAALRAADAAAAAAAADAKPASTLFKKQRKRTPQVIVALVTGDPVSDLTVAAALAVARPGRDTVHLLTIVQNDNQREAAVIALERHRAAVKVAHLPIAPLVLVRHDLFFLDVLDQHLSSCGATLLVMGSLALTTSNLEAFMSSVTLACLRRFAMPVVVLTNNARATQMPEPGQGRVRCLALVEPHSRPMVHFVCGLLDPQDPLTLGQIVPPSHAHSLALASSMRSLLSCFSEIAAGRQMINTTSAQLEGPYERAVLSAVKGCATQLLALQIPGGALKTVAPHIFNLMRTCPCPMLIYPSSRGK